MSPPRHLLLPALTVAVAVLLAGCGERIVDDLPVTDGDLQGAEAVMGLAMTQDERDLLREDVAETRQSFLNLRSAVPGNEVVPALRFDPTIGVINLATAAGEPRWPDPGPVSRPDDLDELAFATVAELSALIHSGQVTSVELTELALDRLREFDPDLHCVITLTPDRALARARELDRMLARGRDLGPLHGIPYGAKDLLAVAGYRTTWGAAPYREQVVAETATVVEKLDAAGAVLVAKLTLGALAWGDVWFGEMTRNPWNLEEGSSGSSAGSASAVAAGLVPFAIGTETWGSIVSPSTRCGTTGLRPTFGRVSRAGAMALSWSMDKIGPIARTVDDCALVFAAIHGRDEQDPTTVDRPFPYDPDLDLGRLRIGYLEDAFAEEEQVAEQELDAAVLDLMRDRGLDLIPMRLPLEELDVDPYDLGFILSAEAAAAFEELTVSGRDDELVRQERYAWPNVFRSAHFIPAVQYIQANRQRTLLMRAMDDLFADIDVYITPSFAGPSLLITNLTGHPQVVLPDGFAQDNAPHSISFVGRLYDEATVLAVARAYQQATDWHRQRPPGF